jgi:hypothetical protein
VKPLGRTVPSYRIASESEITDWSKFKKSLRGEDRLGLQEIFRISRCYTSASSSAVRLFKYEGLFMSVLLHHFKQLEETASKVEEMKIQEQSRDE